MSIIREAWQSVWRRRDLRPIYEWAHDNVILSAPLTITGRFDVTRSRHFIEPLLAMQDDRVREVNILKPVRGGGTLMADIFVPWARVNDPGPTMFLLQTEPIADDHFSKVLEPTIRSVESIRSEIDALPRFAAVGRKIEFADGNHLHINGPSIGNLQTNAFRYLIEDECWLYPDKMADAEGRVGDFQKLETSKIIRISQGGPRHGMSLDECAWNRAYQRGERREWEVGCVHCGEYFEPVFTGQREDGSFYGITWDHHKKPNGDWDLAACCATVRFECPHCRKPMMDSPRTKGEWNRTGRYKLVGEANPKRKSFHWESVIDYPWDELVELWLDASNAAAHGDLKPKLYFLQKRRALMRDESSLLRSGIQFKRAVYDVNSEFPDERARYATFDRQEEDLFWWTVRAWFPDKSRRLGFGKCYGEGGIKEIQQRFKVAPNHVGVDSGYLPKGDRGVYMMCARNGWIAFKGDQQYEFPHVIKSPKGNRIARKSYAPLAYGDPESGTRGEGRRYAPLIRFSKHQMNEVVQRLIDSGAWEEPTGTTETEMEKEYTAQMSGRVKVTDYDKRTGQAKPYWKESKNDHARDLANEQVVFAMIERLLPDPVTERLTKTEKEENERTT